MIEIICDILELASNGKKASHIAFAANLNYKRFRIYADYLVERGFLEVHEDLRLSKVYKTTERGKKLLELLRG